MAHDCLAFVGFSQPAYSQGNCLACLTTTLQWVAGIKSFRHSGIQAKVGCIPLYGHMTPRYIYVVTSNRFFVSHPSFSARSAVYCADKGMAQTIVLGVCFLPPLAVFFGTRPPNAGTPFLGRDGHVHGGFSCIQLPPSFFEQENIRLNDQPDGSVTSLPFPCWSFLG